MGDQFRKVEQYSPKSSPRGNRSPVVPRQDSTGTLKTTISLGKNPSIVHSGPFYLMKEPPGESELTGAKNLITHYGLEHTYNKFCGKRLKETLSSFLCHLPGVIDNPVNQDNSTLRSVIEKQPISKEIAPLSLAQLNAFRLNPGSLPEEYRSDNQTIMKRHKSKKKKKYRTELTTQEISSEAALLESHEKKHKKQKRHDEDKERKKRKKEKKKKKQKHSPDHVSLGNLTPNQHSNS